MLDRFRKRRKAPYSALSDEERMSRYIYLLHTMPAAVIERAHETAFKDVPLERRQEMFEQLRPFMSEEERAQAAEPDLLARLVRRAEERRAASGATASEEARARSKSDPAVQLATPDLLTQTGVMPLVAYHFLMSSAVYSYFTVGAGSLGLAGEPAWVTDMVDSGAAGAGGGFDGGFDGGGGSDAGSFSGMDAGSFGGLGGGFDGGGFG